MKFLRIKLVILCLTLSIVSCVNDLNFDKLDDLSASPTFTTSLAFFTINQDDFTDTTGTITDLTITDVSDFTVFQTTNIQKNLKKVDFEVQIKNEFDLGVNIKIEVLDSNDNLKFTLTDIQVDANQPLTTYETISILISRNRPLLESTKIRVTVDLPMGTSMLDPNENKKFEFKSAATYFFEAN